MRNKILAMTRQSIPYVPWLRPIAGSVCACILMQQLDFWFAQKPDGFYKFMVPCPGHEKYRPGDSWLEELAVGADEFRTSFDKIGMRHTSKSAFDAAWPNTFRDRYYCSYHDKRTGLTHYFRNHDLLDCALDNLCKWEIPFTVNRQSPSTVTGDSQLPVILYTETTNPEITSSKKALALGVTDSESPRAGARTPNANASLKIRLREAERAVEITGDEKSRRRYEQLFAIVEEEALFTVWDEAMKATKRAVMKAPPPARPGAYFCKILTDLLLQHGVSVPVGTAGERADVKALMKQSLGEADG